MDGVADEFRSIARVESAASDLSAGAMKYLMEYGDLPGRWHVGADAAVCAAALDQGFYSRCRVVMEIADAIG